MLPYTPLQYLLFHEAAGRPAGTAWLEVPHELVLVMTSANPGGEPLVTDNGEAVRRLSGIADALLMHDRAIVTRCDDSVLRASADRASGGFQFVRRARGYTPRAIKLPRPGPSVVALGGYFKNTVCVTRGDEAFVSQHIGDLDNAPTCVALVEAVEHLTSMLEIDAGNGRARPASGLLQHAPRGTARATTGASRQFGVQHHHAHIAAVVAEHQVTTPVLGLALDGVGLGTDGGAWGGELLRVDGARCERLGHLAPLRLPGGDVAAREPWRMAAAALARCGRGAEIVRRFADEPAAPTIASMLARGVNSPATSSMGRYFDAAAGLLGVKRRMAFEGQAAMLLEGLADRHGRVAPDDALFAIAGTNELDLAPLLARLADEARCRLRRRAVPCDDRPRAGGMGRASRAGPWHRHDRLWRRLLPQCDPRARFARRARRARPRHAGSDGRAAERWRPEPGTGLGRAPGDRGGRLTCASRFRQRLSRCPSPIRR